MRRVSAEDSWRRAESENQNGVLHRAITFEANDARIVDRLAEFLGEPSAFGSVVQPRLGSFRDALGNRKVAREIHLKSQTSYINT